MPTPKMLAMIGGFLIVVMAISTSGRACWQNLGGVLWYLIVVGLIGLLAAIPC